MKTKKPRKIAAFFDGTIFSKVLYQNDIQNILDYFINQFGINDRWMSYESLNF